MIKEFFKHLLFDQYFNNDIGNSSEEVAKTFAQYITEYLYTNNIDINSTNKLLQQFIKMFSNIAKYEEIIKNCDIYLNDTGMNSFILLSGYSTTDSGHAITLYIEKLLADKFNLYIINSGEGIDLYHYISNPGIFNAKPDEQNIIIKYDKLNKTQIKYIFLLNQFLNTNITKRNEIIAKIITNIKNKEKYDINIKLLMELKEMGLVNIDLFKKNDNKINIKLFYDSISDICTPRKYSIFKTDVRQISSSCSFYKVFFKFYTINF